MAPSLSLLLFATTFAFLPGLYDCSHVAKHSLREQGTFKTPSGPRRYIAVSHLKMPVVPWAGLAADGIKITECSKNSMTFEGKIDPEDFEISVVIAIPKKLCVSFGCPLPRSTQDIPDRDEIIFRQITSAARRGRFMTIQTHFISGAKVVPTVTLDIGPLATNEETQVSSSRQLGDASDDYIGTVSRVDTVGFNDVKRNTTFNLTDGVEIDVEATFSGGLCEFKFQRFPPQVTFLQTLSADLLARLRVDANISERKSGLLFKEGIPDLGFSQDFALIGRVSIGIILALEYVAELDVNADLSASFTASYTANSKVSLGEVIDVEQMENTLGDRSSGFTPGFQIDSANFTVSGFVGLRPEVEAEIELPLIGEGGIRLAGTVGLEAKVGFEEPPFAPISGRTDECGACHRVGGSLDLVGRRLSVKALIPIAEDREFILADRFFDVSLAQVCFYPISCPGTIEDEREQCIAVSDIQDVIEDASSTIDEQIDQTTTAIEEAASQLGQ